MREDKLENDVKALLASDKCSNFGAFGSFLNEEKEFLERLRWVQEGRVTLLRSERELSVSCKCVQLTSLFRHRRRSDFW